MQAGAPQSEILRSIFVGGGTPSTLSPTEWNQLAGLIRRHFALAEECEWTCEANPESLTAELIQAWAESGVNRVSVGIQAFQPSLRAAIGRRGSPDRLPKLVDTLRHNGIHRLNFDLIFNIPGQTLKDWQDTLRQALAFDPEHLSAYALTIEENSRLGQRHLPQPDDEMFVHFWDMTDETLATAGLRRYEISNFAIQGRECRHNLEIWKGATYLGVGPSAASFDGFLRFTNPASFTEWLAGAPPEKDPLPPVERAAEILATGMRTVNGWSWSEFTARTGHDARQIRSQAIARIQQRGLVESDAHGMRPTRQGLLFNDDLAMELL